MKILDAYILASTKRKTRRIRTALVVIASSLLFAVLFAGIFIAQGVLNAGDQVKDVGFNSRNLAAIQQTGNSNGVDFQNIVQTVEGEMLNELRARKVKVTDTTRQSPSFQIEFSRRLSKIMSDVEIKRAQEFEAKVRAMANIQDLYHFTMLPIGSYLTHQPGETDPLVEKLQKQEIAGTGSADPGAGFGFQGQPDAPEFHQVERGMMTSQLYPGQTFAWKPGEAYPVFVSYAYLEKLADTSLNRLSAAERNAGYRKLMAENAGREIRFCYRNAAAQTQLQAVVHYNYVAVNDKDKNTNPIDVPVCGGFDQALLKKLEIIEKPAADDAEKPLFPLPVQPAPATKNIWFKIVGYVPTNQQAGASDVITKVLNDVSSLPTGPSPFVIPSDVAAQEPLLTSAEENSGFFMYSNLFANFATRDQLRDFVNLGCKGGECSSGKKPQIVAFGNLTLALEGILRSIAKFLLLGMAVIMIVAAVMIMFTISKVISDSSKEIAVFRSLGARRRDIAQIYYTYGLMLAASALILSCVLAAVGAGIVSHIYDTSIADGLIQTTGAYTRDVHVQLLAFNPLWFGAVTVALAVAALIGITVPVLANLRRKLITILREE